jgi:hypothetical protein
MRFKLPPLGDQWGGMIYSIYKRVYVRNKALKRLGSGHPTTFQQPETIITRIGVWLRIDWVMFFNIANFGGEAEVPAFY